LPLVFVKVDANMQTSIKELSATKIVITVTATADDLIKHQTAVVKRLAKDVKVPGFRAGKVPLSVAEKNLDANLVQGNVLEEAINGLYFEALSEAKIRVVSQPKITVTKYVPYTDLVFTAGVDVIPKIKLPDYKNIKAKKPEVKITDADVAEILERIKHQAATYTEVERPAKDGDRVSVDFAGKDAKGQPVANADGKDYPLVLGSKSFIAGFEEQVTGLKKGATKSFTLTFPKDYFAKVLAGQKVTFDITVKKVEEAKVEELNDAFVAKIGPFKTVGDLKADIRQQLTMEREHQANRLFEEQVVKAVAAKVKVDLPEGLMAQQLELVDQEFRQNLSRRGQTFEDYLKNPGKTEEEYRNQELKPVAEERLKIGLVLAEIAKAEDITVSPDELEIRIKLLKGQYKDAQMQAELDKPDNQQDIASRMVTEKTVAKLVSYAKEV
jgi:trigger factor